VEISMKSVRRAVVWTTLVIAGLGCGAEPTALDEAGAETGLFDTLGQIPAEARVSSGGPRVAAGSSTEVWAVTNQWADRDTVAAKAAGVAWGANSGLDWEQKFERWISGFRRVPRSGYGHTIQIPTPYGDRVLNAPTLECAEVAVFLRVTFASWYHLPFFIEGWNSQTRQPLYAGHFGFISRTGARVGNFPDFRTRYRDNERAWRPGMAWPSDTTLRGYRLGSDDTVPWITSPAGAGAGAFFDEAFLNKRVGYFMRLVLLYFGSVNLADNANMFHAKAETVAPGDLLVERWQRVGIGHVIPVVRVTQPTMGRFSVDVISGSMPRRQPVWDDPASARRYFTLANTGGEGMANDGTPYAQLGGGLRRWRTAVQRSGQWFNDIAPTERANALEDTDLAGISARPRTFGEILVVPSVAEQRAAILAGISAARMHLRMYPSSCSARTRREDNFEALYRLEEENGGTARAAVDAQHRQLEDAVFAELSYEQSRTCCWNGSNAAMATVILDLAQREQRENAARGVCRAPTVFRAEGVGAMNDGYQRWRTHAATLGRSADWRAWSADEPCAGRTLADDPTTDRAPAFTCR
jgi:hypothetical protein